MRSTAHGLERVAVIDFDVHHGNGTEEILAGDERVLMVSFFQHPFYPYTGTEHVAKNMVNVPLPAGTKGDVVRQVVDEVWLPRLRAFRPQMLFISAGFDAHREDDLGQMGLVESRLRLHHAAPDGGGRGIRRWAGSSVRWRAATT